MGLDDYLTDKTGKATPNSKRSKSPAGRGRKVIGNGSGPGSAAKRTSKTPTRGKKTPVKGRSKTPAKVTKAVRNGGPAKPKSKAVKGAGKAVVKGARKSVGKGVGRKKVSVNSKGKNAKGGNGKKGMKRAVYSEKDVEA